MVANNSGRKIYRTAQGKQIDLDLLIQRNELTPAVGNVRVNARGDELGPGGKIVKKREDVMNDYYAQKQTMRDQSSIISDQESKELAEFDEEPVPPKKSPSQQLDEWIEDEDGNFTKKGE
jgi:hypothetical protein